MASIYNQQQFYTDHSSPSADKVMLASIMHIGGETQRTLESALQALDNNGGGGSFAALSDVTFKNLEDGHRIVYDAASGKWVNTSLKIVTWADGTDEEIAAMLEAHYNDEIDITDYWAVGDERVVHLDAMSATGVNESHTTQDVTMVLLNKGGKELVTPINGHDTCAFIVGQKDCLNENGVMYTASNNSGWYNSNRRTWCNSIYKDAIPSTLLPIFKQHYNYVANSYGATSYTQSADYFCLASVKEVTNAGYGTSNNYLAYTDAESKNTQFEYYQTSSNRIKKVNGNASTYWTDSKTFTTSSSSYRRNFMCVTTTGTSSYTTCTIAYGIAPYGVI